LKGEWDVEIFRLAAQVLGTQRSAAATGDGTGYVVQTDAGPLAARSLNEAIRLARDHIGRFLHEADRRHATWGLLVQVGEVSAVYGDWPLLPAAGPPSTRRTSLVARIRDRWRGGSAISALENALEIVRAYAATGGRDAA
jgi:hypothetical protein